MSPISSHRTGPFLLALIVSAGAPTFSAADDHDDLPPSHSVTPELYATGFTFAEGPALDGDGNLYVVNYRSPGTIGRIAADGTASIFCDLRERAPSEEANRSPQANGLKVDRQGRIIAADSGAGRLLRVADDGSRADVLADRWNRMRFNNINDVALDRAGNIYFSDPGGSSADNPIGSIYRYDARSAEVTRLDTGLAFPNGLGVTPDQKHLCLAESQKFRLLIYELHADGTVGPRRELIRFPEQTSGNIIGGPYDPDGLIFDQSGRLFVGMWEGGVINVVDVDSGTLIRQYDAGGSRATNCHFYGDYLYTTVAAKEAVFRLKLGVRGFDYAAPPQ